MKMRKKVRKSFKQLLIENKQSLLNNKENMKEIEERIEKRHVAYGVGNNWTKNYWTLKQNEFKKIPPVEFAFVVCKFRRYFSCLL